MPKDDEEERQPVSEQSDLTPEEKRQRLLNWYDSTLRAGYWLDLTHLSAERAAQILSGSNPHHPDQSADWLNVTSWRDHPGGHQCMGPKHRRELCDGFKDVGGARRLIDWLKIAKDRQWRYDPWIDDYLEAASLVKERLANPEDAFVLLRAEELSLTAAAERLRGDHVDSCVTEYGTADAAHDMVPVTTRVVAGKRVKTGGARRSNLLTALIEQAIERAGGSDDTARVWSELEAMAHQCVAPFQGAADGELKYLDGGELKFLKRNNLKDRLRSRRNRAG